MSGKPSQSTKKRERYVEGLMGYAKFFNEVIGRLSIKAKVINSIENTRVPELNIPKDNGTKESLKG